MHEYHSPEHLELLRDVFSSWRPKVEDPVLENFDLSVYSTDELRIVFRRPLNEFIGTILAWLAPERDDGDQLLPVSEASSLLHEAITNAFLHDVDYEKHCLTWEWLLFFVNHAYALETQLECLDALCTLATSDEELQLYADSLGGTIASSGGRARLLDLGNRRPLVGRALYLDATMP
jgi:hypothetical protein